jgi:hypothetical protein
MNAIDHPCQMIRIRHPLQSRYEFSILLPGRPEHCNLLSPDKKNVLGCYEVHANPVIPGNMPGPTLRLRQFLKDGILRHPAWFNHKSPQNSLLGAALAFGVLFPEKFSASAEVLANTASVFLLRNHLQQPQTQLGHPSRMAHIDSYSGVVVLDEHSESVVDESSRSGDVMTEEILTVANPKAILRLNFIWQRRHARSTWETILC